MRPDKWINGHLFGWAVLDRAAPKPPMFPGRAAASWSEREARHRIVEATVAVASARKLVLPDDITVALLE